MRTRIASVILLGFSLITVHSYGQILDDSTELKYGVHTTKVVLEEDVYNDIPHARALDTSFNSVYNYHLLYRGPEVFQNLGNFGTPLGNLYFQGVGNLGRSFGFNSFTPYAFNPQRVRYYDTQSPHSVITYRQGATGIQFGDALYTRNIRPNWNAGFHLRRFTANKTIGVVRRSDRQAEHTSFLFFTRYFTKDSIYQVMANFSVMDHRNYETGGVVLDSIETNDLFDYQAENIHFLSGRSLEKRAAFHLYQQFKPTGPFQIFHTVDYYRQSNRFSNPAIDSGYFPGRQDTLFLSNNGSAVGDRTDFKLFENRAGIKGYYGKLFYHLYAKRRDFTYDQICDSCGLKYYNENFLGGDARFYVLDSAFIKVQAEYLLGRDYLLSGMIQSKWLSGGYSRINHSPTLLQLRYTGSRLHWNNEDDEISPQFKNISVDKLWVKADIRLKNKVYIQPSIQYSLLTDYVYFDTLARPRQDQGTIQYFSADLYFKVNIAKLWLENLTRYANASKVLNVPQWFNHGRIYLESPLFKKAIVVQPGADIIYRSSYFGNSYLPITQQFYLNNTFELDELLTIDVFLNVKIKSVTGFVKVTNVNGAKYFITPWYPGLPRTFEFGIRWMFFD